MENNTFRNHPSIILEQINILLWGLLIAFFANDPIGTWQDITSGISHSSHSDRLIIYLIIPAVILALLFLQIRRWYKTTITIDETSITICRDTLQHSTNTIGIQNISNINIDRSLFERLIGTSKVKINTDSRSTADETDVSIVLRKEKAEWLRRHLLAAASTAGVSAKCKNESGSSIQTDAATPPNTDAEPAPNNTPESGIPTVPATDHILYEVFFDTRKVLMHCLFSLSIVGILIAICGVIGLLIGWFSFLAGDHHSPFSMLHKIILNVGSLISVASVFSLIFASVLRFIRDFIRFYHFHAIRTSKHIHLEYGLLHQQSYEIPVKRIHSIKINRSFLSRLVKRCDVEMINVGLGDEDDEEESTKLLLSIPQEHLPDLLHRLLPEFDEYFGLSPQTVLVKPPANIWWKHLIGSIKLLLFLLIVQGILFAAVIPAKAGFLAIGIVLTLLILGLYFLGCYCGYQTNQLSLHANFLSVTNGTFSSVTHFVDYDKIQYLQLQQSPVERLLQLQNGTVYILAGALDNSIDIPTFAKKQIAPISDLFLASVAIHE